MRCMGKKSRVSSAVSVVAVAAVAAGALTGCGSSGSSKSSGPVSVLYAGSLQDLMQKAVGPGFKSATKYSVNGYGAGSSDLVTDITGKVKQGDVFISATPSLNAKLMGKANGGWEDWYATFATSKLVLGYNPKSKFAAALKSQPWYKVVDQPGFKLGLTPPASDPKGALAVKALDATATAQNLPGLRKLGTETDHQFQETGLEGEVLSGQMDAGFFYLAEAHAAGIPTVPLTGTNLNAQYTITVLNKGKNASGGAAFVKYLLSGPGKSDLTKYGFQLISPPQVSGTNVPGSLKSIFGS